MKNKDTIPFLDLITPHRELEEELVGAFREAIQQARFIGGPEVEAFEDEYAAFCGTSHCVGVGNGTDALRFAIVAAGVKAGDCVLTVPMTFIATTEAISQAGAEPDFVDIDPHTYNMSPERLAEFLERQCTKDTAGRLVNRRTGRPVTAVLPVHLYGQMADMDPILDLAKEFNLVVIEDAAQAHGAEYRSDRLGEWRRAGTMGLVSAFSFYPGKNLGACGEAGAVTTEDPEIAKSVRMLRDHGQARKYLHEVEGYNGRLDAIQAAVLRIKLRHLDHWTRQRREAAQRYQDLLATIDGVVAPYTPEGSLPVHHLFVVRMPGRKQVAERLADAGIATGLHYPYPLHLQKPYRWMGYAEGAFPNAERVAREGLSLPMFPGLSTEDQGRICGALARSMPIEVR